MNAPTRLLALLLAAPVAAQGITLVEGTSVQDLSVRVLDEANPGGPGAVILQNAAIVPVEITGRTVAQEWQTEHSRRTVRNGLPRVELPGGGRLFQYRRLGGQWHGFLWVPADGLATVVLERPGIGATGTDSPFLDRIAVAADGRHAVVAGALGGMDVVRLDGGNFASTGSPARTVTTAAALEPIGVMAGRSHVFFVTVNERLWRCPLADGGQPSQIALPPVANTRLKDQLAMSGDGSTVVSLYGPRDQQTFWLVRETGSAVQLPPPPSKYEEPGYLPEDPGHPRLLLNDDATRMLYTDGILRDEVFVLDISGVMPTSHVTGNANFQPYIGVFVLPSFTGVVLSIAIGDPNRMDWFKVEGTGQVSNLTGTGSFQAPFPAGSLDPEQAARTARGEVLAVELVANGMRHLRRLDPATGAQSVVFDDLLAVPEAGSSFTGAGDLLVRGARGDRILDAGTGQLRFATPGGILLTPPNRDPSNSFTATWVHIAAGFGIIAFGLPNGTAIAGGVEQGIEQIVMTAGGGAVINGPQPRYIAPGFVQPLTLPAAAVRIVVSGAGG